MLSKVYMCVYAHNVPFELTPDLKWLSRRMLLLDQTVSAQPHSNLNSDRYVPSVSRHGQYKQ